MKLKNLARAMADYNSSFTEADLTGMLNVLETIVLKYLSQGFNVELPFGTLKPNATGTCANIQDGFMLGNGNHQLNIFSHGIRFRRAVFFAVRYFPEVNCKPQVMPFISERFIYAFANLVWN